MVKIYIKLESHGPNLETNARAVSVSKSIVTVAEKERGQEILDMLTNMIADKGGDAICVMTKRPHR